MSTLKTHMWSSTPADVSLVTWCFRKKTTGGKWRQPAVASYLCAYYVHLPPPGHTKCIVLIRRNLSFIFTVQLPVGCTRRDDQSARTAGQKLIMWPQTSECLWRQEALLKDSSSNSLFLKKCLKAAQGKMQKKHRLYCINTLHSDVFATDFTNCALRQIYREFYDRDQLKGLKNSQCLCSSGAFMMSKCRKNSDQARRR